MPELKNLFIKGKMNKDLDERLVPQGEYRDALNVSVSYSEGSDVGALQNILGNTVRTQMLVSENPEVYVSVTPPADATCIGTVRDTENDKIYWFGTSATSDYIAELDPSTNVVDLILCDGKNPSPILNFSTSNLITGIAVLDGVLYFTDNLNEPRHVDIEHWRGVTGTSFTTTSTNLSADRISLYKKGPINAPTFHTLDSSTRGGVGTIGDETDITATSIPNLSTENIGDSINITFNTTPNYQDNDIVILKYDIAPGSLKELSVARVKITNDTSAPLYVATLLSKTNNIESTANLPYIPLLEEEEPLFQLKFPRFSYRYKYTNGQYSTMSPFSLPAFIPGDFEYDPKKAYNTGMENTVRALKLQGWVTSPSSSNYEADIEEIEILYKDSVSPNVYIVDGIKKQGSTFDAFFEIKDEQIFKATQSNQLLRPFDSIPKKAKALEITGNRLIFGNYLQNFNYTDKPSFTIDTISRTNSIEVSQKLSLKTNRTYQVGIAFQDAYGRQTPVFTDSSGIVKVSQDSSDSNLQFKIETRTNFPQEITHYKYYIKETSNEYYNLCTSNIYDDENGSLYISIPSAEINKVQIDDFIVLKKGVENNPYKGSEKKFKVIDKINNPPSFLANIKKPAYVATILRFDQEFNEDNILRYKQPGKTPVEGHNTIIIQDAGNPNEPANDRRITDNFRAAITPGSEVRFKKAGTGFQTKIYTVKNVQYTEAVTGDNAGGEITFEEEFGSDVQGLYTSNSPFAEISANEIYLEKVETTDDTGNPQYEGKFFIKLNNTAELKGALSVNVDEKFLNTVGTTVIGYRDRTNDPRKYELHAVSYSQSGLAAGTLNGTGYSSGYHIILETGDFWDDGSAFYGQDPFTQGLKENNYLRISGGDQNILTGQEFTTENALYESFAIISGSTSNSKNVTFLSVPSSIQIGDYVTGLSVSGISQNEFTKVEKINGNVITLSSPQSLVSGQSLKFRRSMENVPNYKIIESLLIPGIGTEGYWLIKLEKPLFDGDAFHSALPYAPDGGPTGLSFTMETRSFDNDKILDVVNPPIFEVEPKEGVLDIYYETEKTFPVSDLEAPYVSQAIPWSNCISFNNGVESDRIRDNFNAPTIGKGVRVSTTFEDNYGEERIKSGLIFSGLYNGKNGINRLNQFIIAENITEEANPIYGSIQKLNTRDTDLTLLCDDKILRVPARKDLLFQADGSPQLTSTDRFLGTIIPYAGNYGCQHPESFADHIYRAYFVDRTRGKVLRLGGDGITEISNYGMKDYFKDKLVAETGYMFGSYDENKDKYNISLPVENTVVSFSESVNGWPTRMSFYEMESGISLNNMYYTFKDGKIFSHDNETRNTFYGTKIDSEVTFYLNGNPGSVKNFRTLNYQGDGSWVFSNITTNKQTGNVSSLVEKEGIYYGYISGESQTRKDSLDLKALNAQGLGTPESINGNTFTLNEVNSALQVGDRAYHSGLGDSSFGNAITAISGNTITLDGTAENNYYYFIKNNRFNTSGLLGYYAEITMTNTSTEKKELYSVGSEVSLSS